jgi:hypothetical protein
MVIGNTCITIYKSVKENKGSWVQCNGAHMVQIH